MQPTFHLLPPSKRCSTSSPPRAITLSSPSWNSTRSSCESFTASTALSVFPSTWFPSLRVGVPKAERWRLPPSLLLSWTTIQCNTSRIFYHTRQVRSSFQKATLSVDITTDRVHIHPLKQPWLPLSDCLTFRGYLLAFRTPPNDFIVVWNEIWLDFCFYGQHICSKYVHCQNLSHLRTSFEHFSQHGLIVNPAGCQFEVTTIDVLGHQLTKDGAFHSCLRCLSSYDTDVVPCRSSWEWWTCVATSLPKLMLSYKNCLPCTLLCKTSALRGPSLGPPVTVDNCPTYQNLLETFKMLPARPMLSQTASPMLWPELTTWGFTMPTLQPIRPMPKGSVIQSQGHWTAIKGQCLWQGQHHAAVLFPMAYQGPSFQLHGNGLCSVWYTTSPTSMIV